jgi:AraC family transcriptional regulator
MPSSTSCELSTHGMHNEAVGRVIASVRSRLDESLSLDAMARLAFASRFHFNRMFRRITGIPPCQFLYALRLEEAKRLLLTTRLKVVDICYEVGYNSLGTFTRRFTGLVGVSPTRFRSQARLLSRRSGPVNIDPPRSSPFAEGASLLGILDAPSEFRGLTFVGLFNEPIPQGQPVACSVVGGQGAFRVNNLPSGTFYLFAVALPMPVEVSDLFHSREALRAGGQCITVSNGAVYGPTGLSLRLPELSDPPILIAIPSLLAKQPGGEKPCEIVPGEKIPPLGRDTHAIEAFAS